MTFSIGQLQVGAGHPCRFVAEISNAHNGDFDRATRLIFAAKQAGADVVKFQCYTPDELVALRGDGPAPEPWGSQGFTMRALYEKARTPLSWFPALFACARDLGIVPCSSVFGLESLALLESLNCNVYKIARLDAEADWLIAAAKDTGKPVIASAGPGDGCDPIPDCLLWCPIGYPQTDFRFRVDLFNDWKPGSYEGFSYHGTSIEPPVVAATLGAKLIECHMMLDAEPSALEANVSLTEQQFAEMVRRVRDVEEMMA